MKDQDRELFNCCSEYLRRWALELSKRLDPSSTGKLLFAAAVPTRSPHLQSGPSSLRQQFQGFTASVPLMLLPV